MRILLLKLKNIHEQVGAMYKRIFSFNNEKEESNFSKGRSRVEVKGDVNYKGKIEKSYLYMFCGESICKK
jgi:hypothetical protein